MCLGKMKFILLTDHNCVVNIVKVEAEQAIARL